MTKLCRALWLPSSLATLSAGLAVFIDSFLSAPFVVLFVVFLFDTKGRYHDYLWLKRLEYRKRVVLFGLFMRTACGREVMKAVEPDASFAYRDHGYRWYHILPDGAFTRNSPLLTSIFWRGLFSGYGRN
jgi:hypothetical protein